MTELEQGSIYAWHFSNGKLQLQDGETSVEAGLILRTSDVPDKNGFHGCVSALDALRFFAVRPNDRIIISRVKLSGHIVNSGDRLIAQQREHLWTADAEVTLEDFAMSYVRLALDWLRAEAVVIPPIIDDTLAVRRRWFAKEATPRDLYAAGEALEAWGAAQPHPSDDAEDLPDLYDVMRKDPRQHYTAQEWMARWQAHLEAEPVKLARLLAMNIRHDTQFAVFEIPELTYHCRAVVCNFRGWRAAMAEDADGATEYLNQMAGWQPMNVLELVDFPPPEPYLGEYRLVIPERVSELHRRLMLLAPDGYKE